MTLEQWATRWNVPHAALEELRATWQCTPDPHLPYANTREIGVLEAHAQAAIRLEASRKGYRLWRNNVGAGKLENGSFVRWGLANDSKNINDVVKSSDLIGIGPGGQFVAREIKAPGWRYADAPRERAQLAFIKLVTSYGGNASFATGEGTL